MSVFFCVGRFVRGIVTLLFTHHTLARHELQEEARFARAVRDEDVLPRLRVARARGEQFVAAKHRVEECDELELRQSVADADTRTRAEGAVRLTHTTVLSLAKSGAIKLLGRRELDGASPHLGLVRRDIGPPRNARDLRIHQGIQIHDARLEIAVNELAARGENVRQLCFQAFGAK